MKVFRIAGLVLVAMSFATGQSVSTVFNAANWIAGAITTSATTVAPLPNSAIAQGSILTVYGTSLGPSAGATDPNPFQDTNLSGTSMSVTAANGQVVPVPVYYTSANQVSGLLPSTTPVGTGTITVTYNGTASNAQPITVVASNLGIFSQSANGQGVGIVTYADYSFVSDSKSASCKGPNPTGPPEPYVACGAANPGDVLTIWATGLGPVTGNELTGAGLGVNMPNIVLTVWLGGVQAPVTYQGRSGCCIGEDQIVFTVPNNAPTGCAVPLMVQIGNTNQISSNTVMISNNVILPVASSGRSCTPSNSTYTPTAIQQFTSGAPFPSGFISLARNINITASNSGAGLIYEDDAAGQFGAYTVAPSFQPYVISYFDTQPVGTCLVYNSFNGKSAPPPGDVSVTGLDAGNITVTGPASPLDMVETQNNGQTTEYNVQLSPTGTYLSRGAYTVSGTGGKDVGKFSASFTIGAVPAWTNQTAYVTSGGVVAITRANGVTVNWTPTSTLAYVEIDGSSPSDATFQNGAVFSCAVAASAGTFTVPATILAALPAGPYFQLDFRPALNPVSFTASGLDVGSLTVNYLTALAGTLQ